MSVAIYTITHVPFTPPEDPVYIPLQVGAALHEHYGYLCDDTGDNISVKNPYYSELTGLYWIWKNNACADYIGLCHYRRYFLNNNDNLMTEDDYVNVLSTYDVIISKSQTGEYDYRTVYGRSHDIRNLDLAEKVIHSLYPEYTAAFEETMNDHHCYVGNLFVAPKELFCSYAEWLFNIFFAMEPLINTEGYDDYHKRLFGFLSEQLLIVWIRHNKLSYYEAPVGLIQEKAETLALKEYLSRYFQNKDIDGAYQCLHDTLEKRPDLLLTLSDFKQDLTAAEHIINICRLEREADVPSLMDLSCDLSLLTTHFRLLIPILERIQDGSVTEQELQYLSRCKVSHTALIYIMQNFQQFNVNPIPLLNQLASVYANLQSPITALYFLEEALSLDERNKNTLTNIVTVMRQLGQYDMADEYQQVLNNLPRRIVVFTGSDIPILNYISEQYILSLKELGHTIFIFDKHNFEQSFEELVLFQQHGLDMAILLNNVCFCMQLNSGQSIWEYWNIPCYNIIVDHPMYYFDTLDNAPATGVVVCSDSYHAEYVSRFYKKVNKAFFLPTAGACLRPYEELKPYAERNIDVLFIGSYKFDGKVAFDSFDDRLYEQILKHTDLRFEQAVSLCLQESCENPTDEELKLIIQKHRFTDTNILSLYRAQIITLLVNSNIHVTVYGGNWDKLDICHHPCFHYKGLIQPEDGVSLMEDSKIVLNQLAWFKAGASERIFEAMLQGAISLTDSSEYLEENFTDGEDIAFYSLKNLEKLPGIVRKLLDDEALAETIRANAYSKALNKHTWLERTKTLLSFISPF